jgi:molybdopterin-guanine dinucleotide biosynthesis protein A
MDRIDTLDQLTGILLAGGPSRRFGTSKALIPWEEGKLIEHVLDVMTTLFPVNLVLVKKIPDFQFLERSGVKVVRDLTIDSHPLGGLYSGLTYSKTDYAFTCACDMPYIQSNLVRALWEVCGDHDAAIPVWNGRPQPLCGIYSRRCLGPIGDMIGDGQLKLYELYDVVRTRFFREEEVKAVDPRGLSFFDVDTIEDYREAKRMGNAEVEADGD